jgi:Fe-S cluster assembly scaffold protein SufB
MELHKECARLRAELNQVNQDCEQAGVMLADAHAALNEHMEIHAKVVNELKDVKQERDEAKEEVAWYGTLMRRTKIGTHETPSLKAYIEQLEARIAALEGEA